MTDSTTNHDEELTWTGSSRSTLKAGQFPKNHDKKRAYEIRIKIGKHWYGLVE